MDEVHILLVEIVVLVRIAEDPQFALEGVVVGIAGPFPDQCDRSDTRHDHYGHYGDCDDCFAIHCNTCIGRILHQTVTTAVAAERTVRAVNKLDYTSM